MYKYTLINSKCEGASFVTGVNSTKLQESKSSIYEYIVMSNNIYLTQSKDFSFFSLDKIKNNDCYLYNLFSYFCLCFFLSIVKACSSFLQYQFTGTTKQFNNIFCCDTDSFSNVLPLDIHCNTALMVHSYCSVQ